MTSTHEKLQESQRSTGGFNDSDRAPPTMASHEEKPQRSQSRTSTAHDDEISKDVANLPKVSPAVTKEDEIQYPQGLIFAVILFSIFLAMFLVALVSSSIICLNGSPMPRSLCADYHVQDRTILSTAIPRITDDFNSLKDVGWYGSSYMLTNCSFQLLFGRIYKFYNTKWVSNFKLFLHLSI